MLEGPPESTFGSPGLQVSGKAIPASCVGVLEMDERLGQKYRVVPEVKNLKSMLPDDVGEAELVSGLEPGVQFPPLCHGSIKLR